jgi:hypothetical protein
MLIIANLIIRIKLKFLIYYKNTTLYHIVFDFWLKINICVRRYTNLTPQGLNFHLSLTASGVCCIIVFDMYTGDTTVKYFTNKTLALRFINSL